MTEKIYHVRQLIKQIDFLLLRNYNNIEVEGEISSWTVSARGHCYFSLKEDPDILPCVLFKSNFTPSQDTFQIGDLVQVRGNLSVYGPQGKYQLIAQSIQKTGQGAFYREFLRLKEKMEKEGLFQPEHKKPIPPYPGRIGVITSARGAAVRDIINIIRRRNPYSHIVLRSAAVQGEEAAGDLVQALKDFQDYKKVDVIILGRGGGSLEDLWAFNEEKLARAVFNCTLPVISAVGHQNDFVITDFVADYRAETPSAAAEKVTENFVTLLENLEQYSHRLNQLVHYRFQSVKNRLENLQKHPYLQQPQLFINKKHQVLDDFQKTLNKTLLRLQENYHQRLIYYQQRMKGLYPGNMIAWQKNQLNDYQQRLTHALRQELLSTQRDLNNFAQRLQLLHPSGLLAQSGSILTQYRARLVTSMKRHLQGKLLELKHYSKLLETTNPFNLLKKGYTIIFDKTGKPVKRSVVLKNKQLVDIRFYDGQRSAKIEDES